MFVIIFIRTTPGDYFCSIQDLLESFGSCIVEIVWTTLYQLHLQTFFYKATNSLKVLQYYKSQYPSITNIKSKGFDTSFTFRDTSFIEVIKLIKTLNIKRASQKTDVPTKSVKLNADFFANGICKSFSYCLQKGEFPCALKHADVDVPVHKKKIKSDKANYIPVSILPNLYKIYEKLTYQELSEHFNSILSPKQCGFQKGYSAQHSLMVVILEKFKESRDKGEEFGAFFTNLSKALDCIDHNLIITKLSWYGVTSKSLKLIFSYLSNRIKGVRINNSYSRKSDIQYCVPQGSVLGPLLFNIDLIYLCLQCENDSITSYADDTPPYSWAQDISSVISEFQRIAENIFGWCKQSNES